MASGVIKQIPIINNMDWSTYLTLPSKVSIHNNNCRISKYGKVCTISFSFKITNAVAGEQISVLLTFPPEIRSPREYSLILSDGTVSGYTPFNFKPNSIDIFPQKAGTTYAIGTCTYINVS